MKRITYQWDVGLGRMVELLPRLRLMWQPEYVGLGFGWLFGWVHVWVWESRAHKERDRAHRAYLESEQYRRATLEQLLSGKCSWCNGTGKSTDGDDE